MESKWVCPKCEREFPTQRALQDHCRPKKKSCIGIWYVCKRCFQPFETQSAVTRHQSLKTPCHTVRTTTSTGEIPREAVLSIRLQKGADDAGGIQAYLLHVIKREDEHEITNVLDVCEMQDLKLLLNMIGAEENMGRKINLLAILADYANGETVSPERSAAIKEFVNVQVTL